MAQVFLAVFQIYANYDFSSLANNKAFISVFCKNKAGDFCKKRRFRSLCA